MDNTRATVQVGAAEILKIGLGIGKHRGTVWQCQDGT